jgi:DNA-binding transcriptional ArsR family regulator
MNETTFETRASDMDVLKDLAKRIDAISNEVRLKIMVIISISSKKSPEKRFPTYANAINKILMDYYHIGISETAIRNHLKILLENGLIKTEPGASNDGRPVMNYVLVPGAIESLSRDFNILNNRLTDIQNKFDYDINNPMLKVLGGVEDGKIFELSKKEIRLGRRGNIDSNEDYEGDVILSNEYESVSRVFKPHAYIKEKEDGWYLIDNGSKGGVYLNNESEFLKKRTQTGAIVKRGRNGRKLKDHDKIKLSLGKYGVELIFFLNSSKEED